MKGKILITDSLFINKEDQAILTGAGYEIECLDTPEATEDQLVEAIKGKVGYILGGMEKLTDKVIDSADMMKAIVFTGIGYKGFIPNHEYVTEKGIAIANTPDGPTHAVAEWAMTAALAMSRGMFEIGRMGEKKFLTTKGIEGQRVGIVGLGRIGSEISKMLKPFKPSAISYYSKTRRENAEKELNISYSDFETLLKESHIVFVCVSDDAGKDFILEKELALLKDDALLVTFMHKGIINEAALLKELQNGRIRAVSDYPLEAREANDLPLSRWYSFNGSNAYNTASEIRLVSDMAVRSLLNLLETGADENKVN